MKAIHQSIAIAFLLAGPASFADDDRLANQKQSTFERLSDGPTRDKMQIANQNVRRNLRNKGKDVTDKVLNTYQPGSFHGLPYRLLLPRDYDPSIRYPLILSLHGRAGVGDDNLSQLRSWNSIFVDSRWREKYPCIVVVPQSWDSWLVFNERAPDSNSNEQTWKSAAWEAWFGDRGYPSDQLSTGSLTMAFLLVDEISRTHSVDEDRV